MTKRSTAIGIILCLISFACTQSSTKVYFIPTIHNLHKINKNYSYDSLKLIVEGFVPDVIAVEIRPEDIESDSVYLSKNYPFEMRMMKNWFPQTTISGFDWLGADIEGKQIPENYWKEVSLLKQYEKALNADTAYSRKCAECDTFSNQRLEILKTYALRNILKSEDSALTRNYYTCLENKLKNSIHERVLQIYDLRNAKILENINKIISANRGKRIVILTGDDHFVYLKDKFQNEILF